MGKNKAQAHHTSPFNIRWVMLTTRPRILLLTGIQLRPPTPPSPSAVCALPAKSAPPTPPLLTPHWLLDHVFAVTVVPSMACPLRMSRRSICSIMTAIWTGNVPKMDQTRACRDMPPLSKLPYPEMETRRPRKYTGAGLRRMEAQRIKSACSETSQQRSFHKWPIGAFLYLGIGATVPWRRLTLWSTALPTAGCDIPPSMVELN